MRKLLALWLLVAFTASLAACRGGFTRPERVLSLRTGRSWTLDSDIHVQQPGGTDLTAHDVAYNDAWSKRAPHYGARLTRWDSHGARTGWSIDWEHPKTEADTDQIVRFSGAKGGRSIDGRAPLSSQIQRFRLSFGHNILTVNRMWRWFPQGRRDDTLLGRLYPYAGVGAGVTLPSPGIWIDEGWTGGYQLAGPAATALVGLNYDGIGPFSMFAEFKATYTDVEIDLVGDAGTVRLDPIVTALWVGAGFRF